MALIQCPECGKEISDKAISCPYCGMPIASIEPSTKEEAPVSAPSDAPTDAFPASPDNTLGAHDKPVKSNIGQKKILIAAVCALIVIIAVVAGVTISKKNAAAARAEYIDTLQSVRYLMISGGADAESVCNSVKNVWYNSIHEEKDSATDVYTRSSSGTFYDDFNTAIGLLYASDEISDLCSDISENQELVASLMKQIGNPDDEFERCYDTITELYDVYLRFTNLALDPGGYSLTTYSSSFSDLDDDFMTYYNKLDLLIPEE